MYFTGEHRDAQAKKDADQKIRVDARVQSHAISRSFSAWFSIISSFDLRTISLRILQVSRLSQELKDASKERESQVSHDFSLENHLFSTKQWMEFMLFELCLVNFIVR